MWSCVPLQEVNQEYGRTKFWHTRVDTTRSETMLKGYFVRLGTKTRLLEIGQSAPLANFKLNRCAAIRLPNLAERFSNYTITLHCAVHPPSITMSVPVMKPEASELRNTASAPISSNLPQQPGESWR